MTDQIKQELLQINAQMFELSERKKQLQVYMQARDETRKESQEIESQLQERIESLTEELESNKKEGE